VTPAPAPSRIEAARLRAENAKLALSAAGVVLFVALLLLVRASHPARSAAASASGSAGVEQSVVTDDGSSAFSFSQGSLSQSDRSAVPMVSSGGS
jgi:hypothetical protein